MSDNSLTANKEVATEATTEGSKNNPSQVAESTRVYTQVELDAIAAEVRRKTEAKIAKKYEGVDVEAYKSLVQKEEQLKLEEQKRKGEFEKILKEQADKAQQKIQTLSSELAKIKVDGALINAASTKKAINPEQVARLVRDQVRMSEAGEVEVVDPKSGQVKYTETGDPMTIDGLVSEWLKTNPHFVTAGPAGGGSKSNTSPEGAKEVDISKLNLNNPADRAVYKELRKKIFSK
jgi:hypothetical protein